VVPRAHRRVQRAGIFFQQLAAGIPHRLGIGALQGLGKRLELVARLRRLAVLPEAPALPAGKDDRAEKERALLVRFRETLEKEQPLRTIALNADDNLLISSYPFLTRRAIIVALNVADQGIDDASLRDELEKAYEPRGASVVQIAVHAEAEIASLDDPAERAAFMQDMGITTPALHLLTSKCIDALGLMSFFTVGEDEVRQWFVRRGAPAPEAAGAIHSDLQRGFIRAEVMKYDDLIAAGSEDKLKSTGKYYLKGKDYTVEDGDIARRDQLRLTDIQLTPEEMDASDHTVRLAKRSAAMSSGKFHGMMAPTTPTGSFTV